MGEHVDTAPITTYEEAELLSTYVMLKRIAGTIGESPYEYAQYCASDAAQAIRELLVDLFCAHSIDKSCTSECRWGSDL